MTFTIGFSGPAGAGVNTAGIFLAEFLTSKGYHIWADKEYASIIKGGNNCFFVSASNHENVSLSKKIDLFFAFDQLAIDKNKDIYNLQNIILLKDKKTKILNMFALGASFQMLGFGLEEGLERLQRKNEEFETNENKESFTEGWLTSPKSNLQIDSIISQGKKSLKLGNQLLAEGAISAGMRFYSAYPMTPITGVIDTIVEHPEVTFFQGEDEIAVAMTMLGATYAGKRAMCGTSGGGFALMAESISFSHQAEIGGVYLLGMRDGPSTGTPTFTGQGDLAFAMNASFGETSPIVMAPSSFEEAFTMMKQAFEWSEKYQHPTIILVDKQLAEGYKTVDLSLFGTEKTNFETPETDQSVEHNNSTYLRYQDTESGISPKSIPGTEGITFMTTSYEHTQSGETNESPEIKKEMVEKRFRKRLTFYANEDTDETQAYEIINPNAENFFITRGINRYNLAKIIADKPNWGLIIIKVFQPFSIHLQKWFNIHQDQIKKLIFVEMNHEGQMEKVVRNECNLKGEKREEKISHYRKYNLYPIFIEEVSHFIS